MTRPCSSRTGELAPCCLLHLTPGRQERSNTDDLDDRLTAPCIEQMLHPDMIEQLRGHAADFTNVRRVPLVRVD